MNLYSLLIRKVLIMSITHSVPLSAKQFTENDLAISLLYVNPQVYPGLYDNSQLREGFRYVTRKIMNIDDIIDDLDAAFNGIDIKALGQNNLTYQHQAIRANSRGENADDVDASINGAGYELCHVPVSVCRCPNGSDMRMDGRTRLTFLRSVGFKNIIVDYYESDTWEAYFIEAIKRNPPSKPRSPMKKEDIVTHCNIAIEKGWMKREPDDIIKRVRDISNCMIKSNTLDKIVHSVMYGTGHTSAVLSLNEDSAKNWLRTNGYFDNDKDNGIYYHVVSSSAWTKAIKSASDKYNDLIEDGRKVKELRVVIHTGTLEGANPATSWKGKIDAFRNGWKQDLTSIETALFTDYSRRPVIKLYGAIPAVSMLSAEYPMDRLVMFHVGQLKNKDFSEIDMEDNFIEKFMI